MPDFRVLIIHMLNIAVMYIVLRYLLYKPVKNFMDSRKTRIEGELDRAKQMQSEAEAVTSQAQGILEKAREESRGIINDGAKKAKEDADGIIRMAEEKATEISRQARQDAENEKEEYRRELQNQVGDLALEVAAKILGREITNKDNDAVIDAFFAQSSAFDGKGGSRP